MKPNLASHKSGLLLTLTASLLWGTTFVASQIGLQSFNPYSLVFLRFGIASIGIAILLPPLRNNLRLKEEFKKKSTLLLGAVYALGFFLQYIGQDLTTASEATLLSNLAPILVPVAAISVLKDSITNAQKAATVLGFIGTLLIASPRLNLGLTNALGDFLLLGTSLCYTLFIVLSKRLNTESVAASFAVIIIVTILLAPVAILFGRMNPLELRVELPGWASAVYLGFACTLIAVVVYLKGLGQISAAESGILLLVQILVGLVLAALFLGEMLNISLLIGAFCILSALILGVKRKRKEN